VGETKVPDELGVDVSGLVDTFELDIPVSGFEDEDEDEDAGVEVGETFEIEAGDDREELVASIEEKAEDEPGTDVGVLVGKWDWIQDESEPLQELEVDLDEEPPKGTAATSSRSAPKTIALSCMFANFWNEGFPLEGGNFFLSVTSLYSSRLRLWKHREMSCFVNQISLARHSLRPQ
jgi:hypothetical protein